MQKGKLEDFINKLFAKPISHDVEFTFPNEENKIIKANKCFLVENSEMWKQMFCGENWLDSGKALSSTNVVRVEITDARSEIFKQFLSYCYLKEINLVESNIIPILLLAEKYMHRELIELITTQIHTKHSQDLRFLIKIYGEIVELDMEIESISALKEYIFPLLNERPELLIEENLFNTLSPSLKPIIFNLFSLKEVVHETVKLTRMIEYGEVLAESEKCKVSEALKDILNTTLNMGDLCPKGFKLLLLHSLFTPLEVCKLTFDILVNEHINEYYPSLTTKYDLSEIEITGDLMIDMTNQDIIDISKRPILVDTAGGDIIFELTLPEAIFAFTLYIENLDYYSSCSVIISHSSNGLSWARDNIYFPIYHTRLSHLPQDLHKIFVKTTAKYKFWKMNFADLSNKAGDYYYSGDFIELGGFSLIKSQNNLGINN